MRGSVLLQVFVVFAVGCASIPSEKRLSSGQCKATRLDTAATFAMARSSVVKVMNESGSGSGFVFRTDAHSQERLIATNYHVVTGGENFAAELPLGDGRTVTIGKLEVVKVDPKNDLALLRVPDTGNQTALVAAASQPHQGEAVLVLGYPVVDGSSTVLTAERGELTSLNRSFENDGQEYYQTNAVIHPGNSGGPVLDGCGRVVAIVVAKVSSMEGVNLLIPAQKLVDLTRAYQAPREGVEIEARRRMNEFLSTVAYSQSVDGAEYFARSFLRERMMPLFLEQVQNLSGKVSKVKAYLEAQYGSIDEIAPDTLIAALGRVLTPSEKLAFVPVLMMSRGDDAYAAMRLYVAMYLPSLFGPVEGFTIDRVQGAGEDQVRAMVRLEGNGRSSRWVFELHYEWGDWRIANLSEV